MSFVTLRTKIITTQGDNPNFIRKNYQISIISPKWKPNKFWSEKKRRKQSLEVFNLESKLKLVYDHDGFEWRLRHCL